METNSGQPCGICGDIGYAKDIATCSKCRKSREHIYCMNPNLFNVPRSWHCEACQRDNLVHRNTIHSDGSRRNVEVQDSSKRQKTWISENASSQVPDASNGTYSPSSKSGSQFLSKNVVPKKAANGKVKYIPAEDVCGPSGAKSKLKSVHGASNSQMRSLGANRNSILKRPSAAPKSFPEKVHAYKSASHLKPPTVGEVTFSTLQKPAVELSQSLDPCKSSTREEIRYMTDLSVRDKRHISEAHPSPFSHTGTMASGAQQRPEFGETSSRLKIDAGKVDSLPAEDYVCKDKAVEVPYKFGEEDLPNPPAIVASWKGCFEVLNFFRELCDGFQAYLPEKVSPKAYVVSKQLPRVLKFTLLPRRDVWPEIFNSKSPCAFDVALYFWVDEFCRENYNRLIELMDKQDLSMRSHLDGVDLLLFTSRQLPIESQRMNTQSYLWGVFHSSKEQQAVESPFCSYTVNEDPVSVSQKVDGQRVDGGIEIVASEGVRIVDKWMTSNPITTCTDDSQDAFSRIHSNQPVQNSTAPRRVHDEFKREQCNELDAPPGFSRPVTINASDNSHIAPPHPKMSHVAKEVNTPGSSNWTKLREMVSSSKVTASEYSKATPLNENSGRGLRSLMKTADLPVRPWQESHDGRTRDSIQSREKSTWDPIPSKKLHDGKDLFAEQASERGLSWDHMIRRKKEYNDGWGNQEGVAIQSNENDGWGDRQSVATQSRIPSKKLDDGKNLLAQQAGEENSWDHMIPPKKEYHDGWGNKESVSTESSEKRGHNPVLSRKLDHAKEDLLVKQASGHKGGWDHMIPPKRTNNDGWGKKSIAMQSNENNGDRDSTRKKVGKESNEGDNGRDLCWDPIRRKKEHYDGWGTNSVTPTHSNGRDHQRDPIRPEREPCHVWRRDFSNTQSREENARRDLPSVRPKSEPRNGRGKDFASSQSREENARRDSPIRPNKHNERGRDFLTRREHNDGWRKNRR